MGVQVIDPKAQPIAYIQQVVAQEFCLPVRIMTMEARGAAAYDEARMAAYFVARLLSPRSSAFIAKKFNRDPRTFANGVARTWERMQMNERLRLRVARSIRRASADLRPQKIDEGLAHWPQEAQKIGASQGSQPETPTLAEATANE